MQENPEKAKILEMLQRIPVFGGVAEAALLQILDRSRPVRVSEGDYFFRESDRAASMFVLVEGGVEERKTIDGTDYDLGRLEPGDCFGELELIDFCPRATSVRAVRDCRAIEVTAASLHAIYKLDPASFTMLQMNMGREVSRRLRRLEADLPHVRSESRPDPGRESAPRPEPAAAPLPPGRCVVCAKHVSPSEEHLELWHEDTRFVACCPVCAACFREDPRRFVNRRA